MSTEPLSTVPNSYAYIVQATLLPLRKVQTELVTLYFQHVHPMFPIVDEYKITEAHRKYRGREECMDVGEFAVYQGVLCAGFAVSITTCISYRQSSQIDRGVSQTFLFTGEEFC